MARLIDADNLLEALGIFKDYEHGNPHFMNGIETARELVIGAPTADAEPVCHGRWIDECCSICGKYVYHGDAGHYCPNCGAKMDGGEM